MVVPPQAALRVPLSKSSAMRTGGLHRLVEVAVRVDAARRDDAAGGVDLARPGRQSACAELRDAAARMPMSASNVSLAVATRALRTTRSNARAFDGIADEKAAKPHWVRLLTMESFTR